MENKKDIYELLIKKELSKFYLFYIFNSVLFFIPVLVPIYSSRGGSVKFFV
jgi:hypothetical protein